MEITINPFQLLYFSDDTQTEKNFVDLFSSEVLQTAIHPVFQVGNVILSGTQGCGKTMILSLLRPQIRIAYSKANKQFPVPENLRNFVSAGINLTRSRITDILQVTLGRGDEIDQRELPLYFSDFFNYLIIDDLLSSTETIGSHPDIFGNLVNLSQKDDFIKQLSKQDCWFGYLDGISSWSDLRARIHKRIEFYRKWVNGNTDTQTPPDWIRLSKTNISEPIARTAECLHNTSVICQETPVLIRVDQIEELHKAHLPSRQKTLLISFRKLLNRAFASRDARVHYRAGTRRYGWNNPDYMGVWGSEATLENRRDYLLIDMDEELFARGEVKNSIFEKFAIDAFQKRVKNYYPNARLEPNLAKRIFGKSPIAVNRIKQLSLKMDQSQFDRALALNNPADPTPWSEEWRAFLWCLFSKDHAGMLDATLASAWGRQTGGGKNKPQHRSLPPPASEPWKERIWWRKERLDHAVLQLMTRCQQRFMWWGFEDIVSLSGGNITVFLHICHRVWDGFLKFENSLPKERKTNILIEGTISNTIQDSGIIFASNEWFNKLPEEPGGDTRKQFVEKLGGTLNELMLNDLSMSYPGGNGFSLKLSDLDALSENSIFLKNFLFDAVGYGVLFEREHSSKSKSTGRRRKFYLNPILCPRFQLPEAKTKEPYYWNLNELFNLMAKAKIKHSLPQVEAEQPQINLSLF